MAFIDDMRKNMVSNPTPIPTFLDSGTIPFAGQGAGEETPIWANNALTRTVARGVNGFVGTLDRGSDYAAQLLRDSLNGQPTATNNSATNPYLTAVNKFSSGLGQGSITNGASQISTSPNTSVIQNPFIGQGVRQPISLRSQLPNTNYNIAGQTANNINQLGQFTPERNDFAKDQRQFYTDKFNGLMNDYTANTVNGSESIEQALAKRSARGVINNQIQAIGAQLTNNNNLVQNDINNSSGLISGDLKDQRQLQLGLGNLGLNEQQNKFNNSLNTVKTQNDIDNTQSELNYRSILGQVAGAKGASDIASSNAEARLRGIQADTAQIPLNFQNQALDVYSNGSKLSNLSSVDANQYLNTNAGKLAVKNYTDNGLSLDDAVTKASQDLVNVQAQNKLSNIGRGAAAVLNPTAYAQSLVKQTPTVKVDSATEGVSLEGNTNNIGLDELVKLKQLQDALKSKDSAGAKKILLDSKGNQVK